MPDPRSTPSVITSNQNARIKAVRRLLADRRFRERQRTYVIEGTRSLQETLVGDLRPEYVLYAPAWAEDPTNRALLEQLAVPALAVEPALLASVSDTVTFAGVLAVVPMRDRALPSEPGLVLVLDGLADPGNLGTILRTAAAAGVDGVLLAPGCVDPYNPKVVRGSMGAHLRLPIRRLDWSDIAQTLEPLPVFLASTAGTTPYDQVDWRSPCALIVGSEARGEGPDARRLATATVVIPMAVRSESLNAAISAAILLFEAARQRRSRRPANAGQV